MKKKALGKSIPDILQEQSEAAKALQKRSRKYFRDAEALCLTICDKTIEVIPITDYEEDTSETPNQRSFRLNRELQGCF